MEQAARHRGRIHAVQGQVCHAKEVLQCREGEEAVGVRADRRRGRRAKANDGGESKADESTVHELTLSSGTTPRKSVKPRPRAGISSSILGLAMMYIYAMHVVERYNYFNGSKSPQSAVLLVVGFHDGLTSGWRTPELNPGGAGLAGSAGASEGIDIGHAETLDVLNAVFAMYGATGRGDMKEGVTGCGAKERL